MTSLGGRHQVNPLSAGPVLGLRQQVRGREVRPRGVVRDHHHLARPGEKVDADRAEDLALRLAHVGVPRAEDLVHGGNRLRPVGHRPDRLDARRSGTPRATPTRSSAARSSGATLPSGARGREDRDLRAPGDPRQRGRHEDGRDERAPGRPARRCPTRRMGSNFSPTRAPCRLRALQSDGKRLSVEFPDRGMRRREGPAARRGTALRRRRRSHRLRPGNRGGCSRAPSNFSA